MNTFTTLFLVFLVISYAIQFWLSQRQKSFVSDHRAAVPDAFKNSVALDAHQKAADYTVEKEELAGVDSVIGIIFLLLLTLGGGISLAFKLWSSFELSPMLTDLGAVATIVLIMTLVEIPTSLYQTFVIEEKYGFNKSTLARFFKDQGISLALVITIGMPILALILWVMDSIGSLWWLAAWAILMSMSLLMSWLFPTVIAPLFNKFTPMEDGSLIKRPHSKPVNALWF
jgi:STE24 endopeptidase